MEKLNIKTASDLKCHYNSKRHGNYFDRDSMRFFGDTMGNYAITKHGRVIELRRKRPVKNGVTTSAYFCAYTAERLINGYRIILAGNSYALLEDVLKSFKLRGKYKVDGILVRDAHLTLNSEVEFHKQHLNECYKNLQKKINNHTFDFTKACQLLQNAVQLYQRKNLKTSGYCGITIAKCDRIAIAWEFINYFLGEIECNNTWY